MEYIEYSHKQASLKCVDENEIFCDDTEKYLKRVTSVSMSLHEESYGELLRNVSKCKEAFLMFLKQRTILCEPRVRYNPANDITGLDEKIHALELSSNLKSFLREASNNGYKCLKERKMLKNLVEFDTEQPANVMSFGEMVKLVGRVDMVTLIDDTNMMTEKQYDWTKAKGQEKPSHAKEPFQGHSEVLPCSSSEATQKGGGLLQTTIPSSTTSADVKMCDKAAISVILTPRNFLYATDIYNFLLFSYLNDIKQFYCIVLHVGPLVDKQEIVLYNFNIPSQLTELITSFDRSIIVSEPQELVSQRFEVCLMIKKTKSLSHSDQSESIVHPNGSLGKHKSDQMKCLSKSNDSKIQKNVLDLNRLEALFRKTFGPRIQMAADLRLYFKYYISDCKGVKDHLNDKKLRYERHLAKKKAKKERKLSKAQMKDQTSQTGNQNIACSVAANPSSDQIQIPDSGDKSTSPLTP